MENYFGFHLSCTVACIAWLFPVPSSVLMPVSTRWHSPCRISLASGAGCKAGDWVPDRSYVIAYATYFMRKEPNRVHNTDESQKQKLRGKGIRHKGIQTVWVQLFKKHSKQRTGKTLFRGVCLGGKKVKKCKAMIIIHQKTVCFVGREGEVTGEGRRPLGFLQSSSSGSGWWLQGSSLYETALSFTFLFHILCYVAQEKYF